MSHFSETLMNERANGIPFKKNLCIDSNKAFRIDVFISSVFINSELSLTFEAFILTEKI